MASRYARSWNDPAIQGVDLALRELDGLIPEEQIRAAVRECTDDAQRDAVARWDRTAGQSRTRTQRYREAIRKVFFDDPDGFKGSVFVAGMTDDRGQRPVNLPLWLEYGTRAMHARAHLIPAFEMARRKLDRLVESILRAGATA